jgi:hypothetical protein
MDYFIVCLEKPGISGSPSRTIETESPNPSDPSLPMAFVGTPIRRKMGCRNEREVKCFANKLAEEKSAISRKISSGETES